MLPFFFFFNGLSDVSAGWGGGFLQTAQINTTKFRKKKRRIFCFPYSRKAFAGEFTRIESRFVSYGIGEMRRWGSLFLGKKMSYLPQKAPPASFQNFFTVQLVKKSAFLFRARGCRKNGIALFFAKWSASAFCVIEGTYF